ncbi:hypothetical protein TSUD_387550 [Trifolium subterraneum]|uniref:Aminotransferase-like plant mobile domain-containing protein n=1 Tax=Trifolium subterraneum TaxID=3900 RepID=A0A2Z6N3L0_TRISU|nr:hypothetical protein TSUD_387550 [Trifolium subterraneum]
MTDEVGRTRGGRESRAHGSARRELVNVDKIPSRAKGKKVVVAGSSQAQEEERQDEIEEQMEVTEPGLEEQQLEEDLSDVFDFGDEEEEGEEEQQVEAQAEPKPQPPQREKNTRTTQGRNPPRASEAKVSSYPGGPTDLSLLPGFGKHVAASLWRGECKTRYLRCMNNGKKINEFTLPKSNLHWFWDVVKASGLQPLLKTNYNNLDWGLLTALTERWQPETGTFHLPICEVTITLDDVSCLLHIPITGKMLNHLGTSCTTEECEDMCREYLNFPRTKCRAEFKKMKGAHIGFPMLEKIYAANLRRTLKAEEEEEEEEVVQNYRDCTIRAFLLYLIGGTIFTTKSMQYVDVVFLTYLQDLNLLLDWYPMQG